MTTEAPEATTTSSTVPTAEAPPSRGPGDPAVYDRLDDLTDCAALQEQFDIAAANNDRAEPGTDMFDITLSYMLYADERMQEEGCY